MLECFELRRAALHVCRRKRTMVSAEAGAELVEFAFVVPLLLTLLLGIVWMGRAYNIYQTITRAAREGARYSVLPSCATCGGTMADTYASVNTCLGTGSNAFTNFVSPALQASSLNPASVLNYCQAAIVLNPNTDTSVQQCGVAISFKYPVPLAIPFTSFRAMTINIPTQVQMRMENQSVDSTQGLPQCPGNQ
jgi:Flp pilus assembly protein TadG